MSKDKESFSLQKRIRIFGYAFRSLLDMFKHEHNVWKHLVAGVAVVILGFVFHISIIEWMILSLVIGLVFAMELINSALERLAPHISQIEHHTSHLAFLLPCVHESGCIIRTQSVFRFLG